MADRKWLICDVETRVNKELIRATQYADATKYHDISTTDIAYQQYKLDLLHETQGRSDFIPVTYHVPISIAVGYVEPDYTLAKVETLATNPRSVLSEFDRDCLKIVGDLFGHDLLSEGSDKSSGSIERAMVEDFWRLVNEGYTLVTFNGRGFDLPVLELAALRYGLQAPRYWNEKYGHRYRFSEDGHYDLQDVLTNAGAAQLRGGLNALATMLGYAGKDGTDGSMVQAMFERGELEQIHAYCRRDIVLTWALFIRLELIRGRMTPEQYDAACKKSSAWLVQIQSREGRCVS